MDETKIKIVGVGGAGCRMVDIIGERIQAPSSVVAINTDAAALSESKAAVKLQIGDVHTSGKGTGGDSDLGRLSARDEVELIRGLLSEVELVFVVVGLGGGTGTGATPVIIDTANEEGATVLCFATLPFSFEGPSRSSQAKQVLEEIQELADALIVIPNDRLAELADEDNLSETFSRVDDVVASGVCAVEKLITQPGLINLDFADLQSVVKRGTGLCTFAYGEGKGKGKAGEAIEMLLTSPLVDGGKVFGRAAGMLVSIVGGEDLALKEVSDVTDAITSRVSSDCHVFVGTVVEERLNGKISLMALISEEWKAEEPEEDTAPSAAVEPVGTDIAPEREIKPKGKETKAQKLQAKLKLELSGKGRFKDVEPTIMNGQDLDIPTFVRRGISI